MVFIKHVELQYTAKNISLSFYFLMTKENVDSAEASAENWFPPTSYCNCKCPDL
jgi:hypothetical protein